MLSAEQIKAARAMLDWSQDVLAQACGLSLNTVHSLEKGHLSSRSSTEIRKTFEAKGFEFFGTTGLNRRSDENRVYEGPRSAEDFYEDILATVQKKRCEVAAIFRSTETLSRSLGDVDTVSFQRLEQLGKISVVKCLVTEMRHVPPFMPNLQFRTQPHHPIGPLSEWIYDNKIAVVVANGAEFTYFMKMSTETVEKIRLEFLSRWDAALPIGVSGPAKA